METGLEKKERRKTVERRTPRSTVALASSRRGRRRCRRCAEGKIKTPTEPASE